MVPTLAARPTTVPFFRVELADSEIAEVVDTLRSGWLTTGSKGKHFEADFASAVQAKHAVALNSCTAALHLGGEALQLQPEQAVLVPTMTFAATAEVIRYQGAAPILVDCDPVTGNMSLQDARNKLDRFRDGKLLRKHRRDTKVVGIMPVHVGGLMMNVAEVQAF